MNYTVLAASEAEKLSDLVNEAIRQGWTLQGGVSVAYSDYHTESTNRVHDNAVCIFAQAMVR